MVFEKRLAKIGKGFNVNLYAENDDVLDIFLYNNSLQKKYLNVSNERYELTCSNMVISGHEVIKISSNLYLIRVSSQIYLVNNDES